MLLVTFGGSLVFSYIPLERLCVMASAMDRMFVSLHDSYAQVLIQCNGNGRRDLGETMRFRVGYEAGTPLTGLVLS